MIDVLNTASNVSMDQNASRVLAYTDISSIVMANAHRVVKQDFSQLLLGRSLALLAQLDTQIIK